MKYFLTTRDGNRDGYTRTYDNVGELNAEVTRLINAGYEDADRALDDKYIAEGNKYYAVVQGVQIHVEVTSVEIV